MALNVMHLIWALTPGGAERVAADLALMADDRLRLSVACLQTVGSIGESLRTAGLPLFCLGKRPGCDFRLPFRLARLLRQQHVQILHAHMFSAVFWGKLAALLAGGIVILQHEHSTHTLESSSRLLIDRSLANLSASIITVSGDLGVRFCRAGYPACRIRVIPNGIDPEHFPPPAEARAAARQRLGLNAAAPAVVIIGALEPRKGHDLLLQAWERFCALWKGETPILLVVGDGPLRAELEKQAREMSGGARVIFCGERSDVREMLWASDAYVSASRTEGTSLAMLEAMAAGVPIVATAVGGTPEVLAQGEAGILVPPFDAEALAQGLSRCLGDVAASRRRAQTAQARVKAHYSLATARRRIGDLYLELATAGGATC